MTQINPRTIARGRIARGTRTELAAREAFFDRIDRGRFLAFFARTNILLSEILRSFRSAQSKYRIDCGGTDILLGEILRSFRSAQQMRCPRERDDGRP
jgi:hypothetical protein